MLQIGSDTELVMAVTEVLDVPSSEAGHPMTRVRGPSLMLARLTRDTVGLWMRSRFAIFAITVGK